MFIFDILIHFFQGVTPLRNRSKKSLQLQRTDCVNLHILVRFLYPLQTKFGDILVSSLSVCLSCLSVMSVCLFLCLTPVCGHHFVHACSRTQIHSFFKILYIYYSPSELKMCTRNLHIDWLMFLYLTGTCLNFQVT